METESLSLSAIIAAGITGLITLLGLIISKEQKTSEFRQQWIDALREEISCFVGHIEVIVQQIRQAKLCLEADLEAPTSSELLANLKNEMLETEKHYCKILLRINPEEHHDLINIIESLRHEFFDGNIPSGSKLHDIEMRLIKTTQKVLKTEWVRVKEGELTFKIAKYSALAILMLSLIIGGLTVVFNNSVSPQDSAQPKKSSNKSSNPTVLYAAPFHSALYKTAG